VSSSCRLLTHDAFICVTWFIHTCDMAYSYVWLIHIRLIHIHIHIYSFIGNACLRHATSSHTTYLYAWHDLFIRVIWLPDTRAMTHSYSYSYAFIHRQHVSWPKPPQTRPTYVCDMTDSYVWLIHIWLNHIHIHMHSLRGNTCLAHRTACSAEAASADHDTFARVTRIHIWLIHIHIFIYSSIDDTGLDRRTSWAMSHMWMIYVTHMNVSCLRRIESLRWHDLGHLCRGGHPCRGNMGHLYLWHDSCLSLGRGNPPPCDMTQPPPCDMTQVRVCAETSVEAMIQSYSYSFRGNACLDHGTSCVMSLIWMCYVTRVNVPCHTFEWVTSHIWMSLVAHTNESCHTSERVSSHIWMCHVYEGSPHCGGVCVCIMIASKAVSVKCHVCASTSRRRIRSRHTIWTCGKCQRPVRFL